MPRTSWVMLAASFIACAFALGFFTAALLLERC